MGILVKPCGTSAPGVTNFLGALGSFTCGAAMTDVEIAFAFPAAGGGAEHGAVTVTCLQLAKNLKTKR
ncbi:hypothetical protein ES702_03681 [subsurface metagenome]